MIIKKILEFKKKRQTIKNNNKYNEFIDKICYPYIEDRDIKYNHEQRVAVLTFWYDAEMGSGGHCGFFECYEEIDPKELYDALLEVSDKKIADNFKEAVKKGEKDDWEKTDTNFYNFEPSLSKYHYNYVLKHEKLIFEKK